MPDEAAKVTTDFNEFVALLKGYFLQETVAPLKQIVRKLAFGVAAAISLGIGLVLLSVGVLRVFESDTGGVFQGSWSWVPYFLTVIVGLGAMVLAGRILLRSTAKVVAK